MGIHQGNPHHGTAISLALKCLVLLLVLLAGLDVDAAPEPDGLPVRPANAETVFDQVLVFPAAADDQAIESWRQRAVQRIEEACLDSNGCTIRFVRFHVSARWQLPMIGISITGRSAPIEQHHAARSSGASEPVWLPNTSIAMVRAQVAALMR